MIGFDGAKDIMLRLMFLGETGDNVGLLVTSDIRSIEGVGLHRVVFASNRRSFRGWLAFFHFRS